jgi:hypothetical protein
MSLGQVTATSTSSYDEHDVLCSHQARRIDASEIASWLVWVSDGGLMLLR